MKGYLRVVLVASVVSAPAAGYLAVSKPPQGDFQEPVALGRGATFDDVALRTWTTEEGLPSIVVLAMAQTSDGMLWVGTEQGLARFDGRAMKTVLERVTVTSVLAEGRAAWVGHSDGLARVVDGEAVRGPHEALLRGKTVRALVRVGDDLVAGTNTGELVALARGGAVLRSWDAAAGLPQASITRLAVVDRTLFVGTERGLRLVDLDSGAVRMLARLPSQASITGLLVRGRDVFVSTFGSGLFQCSAMQCDPFVIEGFGHETHFGQPLALAGSSLLVPSSAGLLQLDEARVLDRREDMAGTLVTLFRDRSGSIWAGAGNDGRLAGLRAMQFRGVSVWMRGRDGRAILEDSQGSTLVGTNAEGLFRRDAAGRETPVPLIIDGLRSVRSLGVDPAVPGAVIVAGLGGVLRLRADGSQESLSSGAAPSQKIRAVRQARDGRLVLGSQAGLLVGDGVHDYQLFPSTPATWFVVGVNPLPNDEWLVATNENGLWRVPSTGGPAVSLVLPGGVGSVARPLVRGDGVIVTPVDSGLCVALSLGARSVCFGAAEGLVSRSHVGLVDDGRGSLWVATTGGVSRVSWQELLDAAAADVPARVPFRTLRHFTMRDGLPSNGCNGGDPDAVRLHDGRLAFACMGGVAVIDPDLARADEHAPTVIVEAMEVDGAVQRDPSTEPLAETAQRVTFAFAAPSFVGDQKKQSFRVKLEGFDRAWTEGDRTTLRASYTNLPRGQRLRFLVMASNNDGVWNESPAAYAFTIAPRWFERVGVRLGVVALFAGVVAAAFKARTAQLKARAAVLEVLVEERTEALRNALHELDEDLAEARRFQELSMGALPVVAGLEVATRWLPAATVGGDFFVAQAFGGGLRVLLVDATGHGVQAALRTMVLKTAFDAGASREATPGDVLARLNDALIGSYGELEAKTDAICVDVVRDDAGVPSIRVATAGSMSVALVHSARVDELRKPGFALGVMPRRSYATSEAAFPVGARAVLVSDGILEQPNAAGSDYDWGRFEALCREPHRDAAHVVDALVFSWNAHRGATEQRDDATVLVIGNDAFVPSKEGTESVER